MGDPTERLAVLHRGLSELREALATLEADDERAALQARIARIEERAARWSEIAGAERVLLLNEVFDATVHVRDLRRRSGVWSPRPVKEAK